jgi:DNA-binding CsgD family transcriptional regulator/tetratricopeptide (TPR) repeat protein
LSIAVQRGLSQALVVWGEAGVGKTALLNYLSDSVTDHRVLRATGVESEMELPFAVLHQLCAPMLDGLDRLPEPQREALSIVFGRMAGPRPGRLLVGLAVLSLISETAAERPLLCVVDDCQWLDKETAQTISLVARRLPSAAVGLVLGTREIGDEFHGLPQLEVRGLSTADSRALLGSAIGFMLDMRILDRIMVETGGNPLALLELPRGLSATQLADGFGLSGPHALPGRIERSFVRQASSLPADTRTFLLVAAAEPTGDPMLVWRAAERVGIEVSAAEAAEMEGLLTVGERVTFRHPLVRSAIYRSASERDRRAAHLALGEVTDREVDPDRRAWHLAIAASGPDDYIATELERSAGRAHARGGFTSEAAFLQRCVALTKDPKRRTGRALAAAQASMRAGAFDTALVLMEAAETGPLTELGRARVDVLRAKTAYALGRNSESPTLLLRAAQAMHPLDARLAHETYLDACSAAVLAGHLAVGAGLPEIAQVARAAGAPDGPTRASDLLLDGLTRLYTEGRDAAVPVIAQAASEFARPDLPLEEVLSRGWLASIAAAVVWDAETCGTIVLNLVKVTRASGALADLEEALNTLCQVAALAGHLDKAASLMDEARAVQDAMGTLHAPYGMLALVALRGREEEAFPLIDETITSAGTKGQGIAVQYCMWARAVVLNGLGRYEEALAAAEHASDVTPELYLASWALSERVEAATRSGNIGSATEALERLTQNVRGTDKGWGLGLLARARALTGQGEAVETCFREAIGQLGRTTLRPELARAHLLYGEWLRGRGCRTDAREQLRVAHQMFSDFGMEAFADRARRELLATGEIVRARTVEPTEELTPQEREIALLARDGLSNPEIGSRLFVSARTVEWHLRKVFKKLNISSRKQLRTVLREDERGSGKTG